MTGQLVVPPEDIRRLRTHTRYRRKLTQAPTAEKQRAEKLLEEEHLKLSGVISDIHGVSGRAMLEAVIAGERNPKTLADLARGVMRRRLALLEGALNCPFFTPEHAFVLQMMLGNIDHYTAQIAVLDERIAVLCEPFNGNHPARRHPRLRRDNRPGPDRRDQHEHDGVPDRRATCAPGPGSPPGPRSPAAGARARARPAAATPTSALPSARPPPAPGRRPDLPRRQAPAPGPAHAQEEGPGGVMRTQLAIAHGLLADPAAAYRELGPGYYEQKAGTRHARGHVRSLERLGYKVTIEPLDRADPEANEVITRAAS